MKSPFTGGKAILQQEKAELVFRKETFQYTHLYYLCEDTNEKFTTLQLDEINIAQVYNQYRVKYGIPFPDEIKQIRKEYGLSAAKMSEILGFGNNQYRLYENGDMPSETNGKLLNSIKQANIFINYVENAKNQLGSEECERIKRRIPQIMPDTTTKFKQSLIYTYGRSELNGYAPQSFSKLKNIILYFIEKIGGIFYTKMNKLLFYADFLSYKQRGYGMSGLEYKAIQYGPVPLKWTLIYSLIDEIESIPECFPDGISGTRLVSTCPHENSLFNAEDLDILEKVVDKFKGGSCNTISAQSHNEDAWLHHITDRSIINYNEAFTLHTLL